MRCSYSGWWLVRTLVLASGCCLAAIAASSAGSWARAQDQPGEIDAEIARQQQIVERFLTVLERNPRRGTALDKIYGFHVENGSLEKFVSSLRERTTKTPDDGTGWMLLGLVESERGRDAAAVEALTKAAQLRAADPLASYYLGQSLVLVGQPEKAATAFEEAIARKPSQVDLLETFQALGRVHQRAQRPDEALAVWNRLEKLFPGDSRVQEQIAVTLVEEGQNAQALPRYEALAKTTTDDYRRTVFRIEAAELKVKLNRASEGVAELEQLLAKLNPESWLFREVRRKIEDVFLRTDDQDGLAKYYTSWLDKNKEDVDAMARLARVLARQARVPEAQTWLDKALKLAPSRKELRLAFVEQLVDDQRYPEAIQQYVALDKADPNNPDYLREWGKLVLRDTSRPKEERQVEAERIWRRLLTARPDDPLVATQVADLFRHAGLTAPALELYEKAVALAPQSPQYLEYLGEYYHILKRTDDALATWRKIADGKLRTGENLARLAEVFAQFGYLREAQPEIAAACELDPKNFSLALKAADLQIRGEQLDAALASLSRGQKLAQNDEEREAVLSQQLKTYTLQNRLPELATELEKQVADGKGDHQQWFLLARYREALREWPEATKAIGEALAREPSSIPSLAAAARIAEQAGDLGVSADFNRKLAVVDRRSRSDYLERVAQLETQLGRTDAALAAGRDLIAAAPGNVETYQFFADLCLRLGRSDEGIAALRRATRVNPNDPNIVLSLAAALAAQFRTDEAIELYWQALEKGTQLDDKLSVIGKLTELHLQINRLDQLLQRLERGRREDDLRREMTICLAQAYHSAGDYGMARQELERLLSENTRDTQLLLQLSKLAESESDLISAVKFQEQLARLAPGAETEYRLATLLSQSGNSQEAAAILVRLAVKEEDKEKLLRNIDSLLSGEQKETALAVLEPKLRENPTDWELLYRQGVALAAAKPDEAARRFQAILDLTLSDDELSTAGKARLAAQRKTGGASATPSLTSIARLDYMYEVQAAVGLSSERYYGSTGRLAVWTPQNFAQARMAAVGWLYRFAQDSGKSDEFVAARRTGAARPEATGRELWDWAYLQSMRSETSDLADVAKRLARMGEIAAQFLFLNQLASRNNTATATVGPAPQAPDRTPPLSAEDLELATKSLASVERAFAGQTSANPYSTYFRQYVTAELVRAGRKEDEEKLYRQVVSASDTTAQIVDAFSMAARRGDLPTATALLDRFAKLDLQNNDTKSTSARQSRASLGNAVSMLAGGQLQPAEVLRVLDLYLDYAVAWTSRERSNPLNRAAPRSSAAYSSPYAYVYVGGVRRRVGSPVPLSTAYLDTYATTLLRTVLEQFKQKDLVSDLLKHLSERADKAAAGDKIYAVLALAYTQIWNDDQETGLATLAKAVELAPQDVELRIEVARLLMQSQRLDEALAMLDAVTPLDQRILQLQETLALDIAVRLGDHERAKAAAVRLFGLRLTPEIQVQLAGQMRRLGMADEADAVIARAQRQAGNRLSALAALMGQYQSEGRMEIAVQAAYQILRRSRTLPAAQQARGISTVDSSYRQSALACLSQAGKLKELIAGVEAQLARSPQSTQLNETLAEYYQAAGDVQKQLDLQAKTVELRPDDAELRYRYASVLYSRGKYPEACDHFRLAILKQPRLLGDRYWEAQEAFRMAKREADLVKLLNEIDIRRLGQPYIALNLISNMMNNEESKPAAIGFLKKAWEAFPSYRPQLMSSFYRADAWAVPELFEMGKQSLLPTADAVRQNPWYGIGDVVSYSSGGKVNTSLSYLLDAGMKNNQLPALRDDVARAAGEHAQWQAGPVILALVDLRLGRAIEPKTAFAGLLAAGPADSRLQTTRWIVAQELSARHQWQPVALDLLRMAALDPTNSPIRQFSYGPAASYVRLCAAAGNKEEARKVLVDWLSPNRQPEIFSSDPVYNLSRRMEDLSAIGQMAQELDLPVEGMRVYRELMTNPAFDDPQIQQYTGRNIAGMRQMAERGLEAITSKLADDPSGQVAMSLLAPLSGQAEGAPAIDLMLAVPVSDSPLGKLDSTLARLLKPQTLSPEAAALLDALLASLTEKHPHDVTVRIVQALVALRRVSGGGLPGSETAAGQASVKELVEFVAAHPLEEIPAGQRPNARQRQEAAQQVGLWLVVRECLPRPELREAAATLSARAIAA
ncbi:MAG: tetratricopeptide repeat protein, partial [Planctomycetaceae bacterium]|nr:tetratricopeptide repeat protein [Planctomycetaceae bacterium]